MALKLLTVLLVVSVLTHKAHGYPDGAPTNVCDSMMPSHGVSPQTTASPYRLTPGGTSIDAGQGLITVTISPTAGGTFKGFILQARDANSDAIVGTFTADAYKTMNCGAGAANSITHKSAADKDQVVVQWSAPASFSGDVTFRATVVQDFSTFWTGIISEKVTVVASTAPTAATTAPPAAPTTTASATTKAPRSGNNRGGGLLSGFRNRNKPNRAQAPAIKPQTPVKETSQFSQFDPIYLGCRVNKGCFGLPSGCEAKENCESLFTYTKVDQDYTFEIMGDVNPNTPNAYVAGGLSFDSKMGSDSVVACRTFNGVVDVVMTWNEGKTNKFFVDQTEGLYNFEMQQVDGKLYCRYNRNTKMDINGQPFDLDEGEFHLMVASGPLNEAGLLTFHSDKGATASATSMDSYDPLGLSNSIMVILHACFMVAAWVGAASTGMLLARYYKQTWRQHKTCGIDQWFHFHRLFMGLTWALTMAGFVIMAVHLEGWTRTKANVNPHAYIGIVSIALCFIQPFMALFRCKPDNPNRSVFNWVHWFVGNAAQILGLTAIFYGLDLHGIPRWTWWLMIVFIGYHVLTHILLSIGECISDNKAKQQVGSMKDFDRHDEPILRDAPGALFRKFMLALYLLVVWLVTAGLISVIVLGDEQLEDWGVKFWEK